MLSKQEFLQQLQQEAEATSLSRIIVAKKKFIKGTAILLAVGIICSVSEVIISRQMRSSAYASGELPTFVNLSYQDNFQRLNQAPIGNDINALLTGGKILLRDNMKVSGLGVQYEYFHVIANASYLNQIGDAVIFRNDKDRHIYSQQNGKNTLLFNGSAGEVFCVGDDVYFVNMDKKRNICLINRQQSDSSPQVIVQESVYNFAVCNDEIVFLTTDYKLKHQALKAQHAELLANNIEEFILNGNIIAKSSNEILQFTTDGELPKKLYASDAEDLHIIGVDGNTIYIQEDNTIKTISAGETQTNSQEFYAEKHKLYQSMIVHDKNLYVTVMDMQNNNVAESILTLQRK